MKVVALPVENVLVCVLERKGLFALDTDEKTGARCKNVSYNY